jgi:uncharacterized alkaline shock family protein YloU
MTAPAERGTTTVSERAVRRIAARAVTEALPGQNQPRAAGAATSVRGTKAEVSLRLTLPYPTPLADTVRNVQHHVVERTQRLSGLQVSVTGVAVTAFTPPGSVQTSEVDEAAEEVTGEAAGLRAPRRRWSQRRVPVALLAWAAAVGCGALAVDLVRTHLAHRAPGAWRSWAVQWLSGHGPGDPAVVAAGGLTALAGLWMVVLALTPGHRRQYTVRGPAPRIDTVIDRSAVAVLVRDAVTGVDGVTAVRARTRRRRVTVRATLAFGDRDAAQAAVTAAARDALAACHLRRGLRLRVTVAGGPLCRPLPALGTGNAQAAQGGMRTPAAMDPAVPAADLARALAVPRTGDASAAGPVRVVGGDR